MAIKDDTEDAMKKPVEVFPPVFKITDYIFCQPCGKQNIY